MVDPSQADLSRPLELILKNTLVKFDFLLDSKLNAPPNLSDPPAPDPVPFQLPVPAPLPPSAPEPALLTASSCTKGHGHQLPLDRISTPQPRLSPRFSATPPPPPSPPNLPPVVDASPPPSITSPHHAPSPPRPLCPAEDLPEPGTPASPEPTCPPSLTRNCPPSGSPAAPSRAPTPKLFDRLCPLGPPLTRPPSCPPQPSLSRESPEPGLISEPGLIQRLASGPSHPPNPQVPPPRQSKKVRKRAAHSQQLGHPNGSFAMFEPGMANAGGMFGCFGNQLPGADSAAEMAGSRAYGRPGEVAYGGDGRMAYREGMQTYAEPYGLGAHYGCDVQFLETQPYGHAPESFNHPLQPYGYPTQPYPEPYGRGPQPYGDPVHPYGHPTLPHSHSIQPYPHSPQPYADPSQLYPHPPDSYHTQPYSSHVPPGTYGEYFRSPYRSYAGEPVGRRPG